MPPETLVLASASPRRSELLRGMGIPVVQRSAAIDESPRPAEEPLALVQRLATSKATTVAEDWDGPPAVVLGADTEVALDGIALGKPADRGEAQRMLAALRDRSHEVITGVCLIRTDESRSLTRAETSRVTFRDYGSDAIERYLDRADWSDKAGAYGIQSHGAVLIERVEGSWTNIIGLPVECLAGWLSELGLDVLDLWHDVN